MKPPTRSDLLDEIRRLTAENARLNRLAQSQRPELGALREVEEKLRHICQELRHILPLFEQLLPSDDADVPGFDELLGCLSDGKARVDEALKQ